MKDCRSLVSIRPLVVPYAWVEFETSEGFLEFWALFEVLMKDVFLRDLCRKS